MKLYTYAQAPNPRRLALFLQLKGIDIDTQTIDMMAGEQLTDSYRQINPAATVPALVLDDGTVLTEVIGMYTYLEDYYPGPALLGENALERALIVSWCHKVYVGLMMGIASMLRNRGKAFHDRALPGPLNLAQIPELVDRGRSQIHHILPTLDTHLADSTWLAGDRFSVADIDLLVSIDFLAWVKESVPNTCPHLQAWHDRASDKMA